MFTKPFSLTPEQVTGVDQKPTTRAFAAAFCTTRFPINTNGAEMATFPTDDVLGIDKRKGAIVIPANLDAWLESAGGPVVLLIQPNRYAVGGQSSIAEQYYESHAIYFDSEDQASEWCETNRKTLRNCLVSRYPIIDGRSTPTPD